MNQSKIKNAIDKLGTICKSFVNSIRIPALINFLIKPSVKDALRDAPPKETNWDRLGLGKNSALGIPVYLLFIIVIFAFIIRYTSEALQYFIEIISKGAVLIPLLIILFLIIVKIKK